jgi:hypothetical protein
MLDLPPYWHQKPDESLPVAVKAYLLGETLNLEQVLLIREYLTEWMDPSYWVGVDELREDVHLINSQEDIDLWIEAALDKGIEPL